MSTDMQRYSIENQSRFISLYAAGRGLSIVKYYEDAGKSGLGLGRRAGLKSLLRDVQKGDADFEIILVYDVSRWGRFQDSDEGAYYEFLCKQAGVTVEYCAELFDNDGSLAATIIKSMKRAMAGEYSRELSVKVFAGQSRVAAKGFHMGSTPGYGLQRCLIDQNGNRKRMLASGEQKSVHTEHTILVPGCPQEISTIQRVYSLFIEGRQSMAAIAKALNTEGVPNAAGRIWQPHAVRQLLANEKYIGVSVYNRASRKLGAPYRFNPKSAWIKGEGAFEPLIPRERFVTAGSLLETNANGHSDNALLDSLTAMWCRHGKLNSKVIDADPVAPSVTTFRHRFGTIGEAMRRVGYSKPSNHTTNADIRRSIRKFIVSKVTQYGGDAISLVGGKYLLLNQEFTVSVAVGRSPPSSRGCNKWLFNYHSSVKPDIMVIARIEDTTNCIKDYFILPFCFLPPGTWLSISGVTYEHLEQFRSFTLTPLLQLCARQKVESYGSA